MPKTSENKKGCTRAKSAVPTTRHEDAALVHLRDGKPMTDTLTIARVFKREHKNVLQSTDALIADSTINGQDFKSVEYVDAKGEKRRMIELTERGALIAMPFVGGKNSRAGQVRLVDAFLSMRERLRARHYPATTLPEGTSKRSSVADREPLYALAGQCIARHRLLFSGVYHAMNDFAGSACFRVMTCAQVRDAAHFAERLLDCIVTGGDWQRITTNRVWLGQASAQPDLFDGVATEVAA
ncbi:Rha family transcriptional regulator [Paraburkholderia sp. BR10937]|uniref:Rha family transcriptional regulator n=1 Tax=Paraburkholderia sp. BR10937 TaxID=3236994 RepID=UPI0034D192DA